MARPAIDVSQMTPDERLDLIGELWDSLTPEDVPLSAEQRAELHRRLERLDAEGSQGSPWSEVLARIRSAKR